MNRRLSTVFGAVVLALTAARPDRTARADPPPEAVEVRSARDAIDWAAAPRVACEPIDGKAVDVRLAHRKTEVYVRVEVPEPPGLAMGVTVSHAPDDATTVASAVVGTYRPQDLRGPEYVYRDPRGGRRGEVPSTTFVGGIPETGSSFWRLTVSFAPPVDDRPFRLAVAVHGRVPNRVAFAPPSAAFAGPVGWARVVVRDAPRVTTPNLFSPEDADDRRLAAWREHLAARMRAGPLEKARQRLIPPLDRAIEARPDLVMLHVAKGDVLRDLGDVEGATAAYDKALEVGPHFPEAIWARERLRVRGWVDRPSTEPSDYAVAFARIAEESKGVLAGSPAPAIAEGFLRNRAGEFDAALRLLEPFTKTHAFDEEIVEIVRLAAAARENWGMELGFRQIDARKDLPRVRLVTSKGPVLLELFEDETPNTVANFLWLARGGEGGPGFYDGTRFHGSKPFSVVRGGDPFSAKEGPEVGRGGPGYAIGSERSRRRPYRGMVAMEDDGPDAVGSRFVLLTGTTVFPEGRHPVFGRVIEGQDVVERLVPGDALERVDVVRTRDHPYRPTTVAATPAPAPRPDAR